MRRLVEDSHPEVAVVSWGELLPSVEVEPIGTIGPTGLGDGVTGESAARIAP